MNLRLSIVGRLGAAGLVVCLFSAAVPASAETWRFAVLGATRGAGTNSEPHPWVNTPVVSALATALCADRAELVLVAGDLIYGGEPASATNLAQRYAEWTNAMAPVYQAGIPVFPVRGRQDALEPGAASFRAAFDGLPTNGPAGELGLTYGFYYKNASFVGFDQFVQPHRVNRPWLLRQLAYQDRAHLFAFGFETAVQAASPECLAQERAARDAFLGDLAGAGAGVYFCGGDAFYNHAEVTAPGGRSLRQLVVGTGGAPADFWDGRYGADFGEESRAAGVRHLAGLYGYALVTVSNFDVTVEWKGSEDLAAWRTLDRYTYRRPNPALVRAHDYDGDGKADPAVYDENTGFWTVLYSSLGYRPGAEPILGGRGWRAAPGDYDGDCRYDMAVMKKDGTFWALLSGSGFAPMTLDLNTVRAAPVCADYDGDGQTDIACYERELGSWLAVLSDRGSQWVELTWGGPGWVPVPADYDGDGKADPCVYREATGEWLAVLSGSGYAAGSAWWGGPGFLPAPADYDGDGRADPCVYGRAGGQWSTLLSGSGYAAAAIVCGGGDYRPLPADYDGDGRADILAYSRALSDWSARLSGSGYAAASLDFGGTNWTAVSPSWRENLVFLAFGDSITYGGGSPSDGPATGYPRLLETRLKEGYDGFFLSLNRGIPGEDTYEGFDRFLEVLESIHPDLVLLMEGTNDHFFGYPFDEIEENLRNMIRLALNRGIPVILGTIPPVISNAYRDRTAQAARIRAFNPRIYAMAADFHIPVARVYEAITAVPNWERDLMDQPSANHPNAAGYERVRDAFYEPLAAGLEAGRY